MKLFVGFYHDISSLSLNDGLQCILNGFDVQQTISISRQGTRVLTTGNNTATDLQKLSGPGPVLTEGTQCPRLTQSKYHCINIHCHHHLVTLLDVSISVPGTVLLRELAGYELWTLLDRNHNFSQYNFYEFTTNKDKLGERLLVPIVVRYWEMTGHFSVDFLPAKVSVRTKQKINLWILLCHSKILSNPEILKVISGFVARHFLSLHRLGRWLSGLWLTEKTRGLYDFTIWRWVSSFTYKSSRSVLNSNRFESYSNQRQWDRQKLSNLALLRQGRETDCREGDMKLSNLV